MFFHSGPDTALNNADARFATRRFRFLRPRVRQPKSVAFTASSVSATGRSIGCIPCLILQVHIASCFAEVHAQVRLVGVSGVIRTARFLFSISKREDTRLGGNINKIFWHRHGFQPYRYLLGPDDSAGPCGKESRASPAFAGSGSLGQIGLLRSTTSEASALVSEDPGPSCDWRVPLVLAVVPVDTDAGFARSRPATRMFISLGSSALFGRGLKLPMRTGYAQWGDILEKRTEFMRRFPRRNPRGFWPVNQACQSVTTKDRQSFTLFIKCAIGFKAIVLKQGGKGPQRRQAHGPLLRCFW